MSARPKPIFTLEELRAVRHIIIGHDPRNYRGPLTFRSEVRRRILDARGRR